MDERGTRDPLSFLGTGNSGDMPVGDRAPLLAGYREEYHDLARLIRPGGLAIRSCDPHILFILINH
jgi:hypothetical protein